MGAWQFQDQEESIKFRVLGNRHYRLSVRSADGTEVSEGTWNLDGGYLILFSSGKEPMVFKYRFIGSDQLCVSNPKEGNYCLQRIKPSAKNIKGQGITKIHKKPERIKPPSTAVGGHIVYTRWGKKWVRVGGINNQIPLPQLWIMDGDGGNKRPFFAPQEGFVLAKEARWSPDFKEIAFVSNLKNSLSACMEDIFIAGPDGSHPVRITGNEMRVKVPPAYGIVKGIIVDNMRTLEQVGKNYLQISITAQGAGGLVVHPAPASEMAIRGRTGQMYGKLRAWHFTIPRVMAGTKVWIKIWADKYVGTVRVVNVAAGKVNDIGVIELNNGLYYASHPSLSQDKRYVFGMGSIASLQENPRGLAMPGGADNLCAYDRKTGTVVAMFEPSRMRGENVKFPAVSPDGRFLAVCYGPEGMESLALLSVADFLANRPQLNVLVPGQRILFQATSKGAASPAWSPDGRKIVFARSTMTSQFVSSDLAIVNADGTGLRTLTHFGPRHICTHPCFSPDGKRIAFTVLTGKHGMISPTDMVTYQFSADIYTMNIDGTDVKRITSDGSSAEPAWGL